MWPHTGGPDTLFGKNGSKGISILGQEGDAVAAVASGKVLYAGSSLKGYGNLLIIKHGDKWLSAYAHNKSLMVKEGATVKKGQVIALMGRVEAPRVMLHFELRYQGRPVDPLLYLPKR
jgi:lipoprotein NlpD